MLRTEELTVRYGEARAVWHVSFVAPAGQITAIVGPNGAGKSSILLGCYGSIRSSGRVFVNDREVSRLTSMARARNGMGLVPQGRQIFPRLTVRQNLDVMCLLLDIKQDRIDREYERFPILKERSRQIAGVLSGGEQQMLAVSRALLGDPSILLLDEVVTGLAPVIVDQLVETIQKLADDGVAVVMAEPSIGRLLSHIDRGYVLLRGEVVAQCDSGVSLEGEYERALGLELVEAEMDPSSE